MPLDLWRWMYKKNESDIRWASTSWPITAIHQDKLGLLLVSQMPQRSVQMCHKGETWEALLILERIPLLLMHAHFLVSPLSDWQELQFIFGISLKMFFSLGDQFFVLTLLYLDVDTFLCGVVFLCCLPTGLLFTIFFNSYPLKKNCFSWWYLQNLNPWLNSSVVDISMWLYFRFIPKDTVREFGLILSVYVLN